MIYTLVGALALLAGGFFVMTRSKPGKPARVATQAKEAPAAAFASVEIRCGQAACADATALIGKKLLAAQAPALPLAGCDANCECRYLKHGDRREDSRRSSDLGIDPLISVSAERRAGADRREP